MGSESWIRKLGSYIMQPLVYLSFAFALSEMMLMFFKRSKKANTKSRDDKGSLIFLWMMITCGFFAAFVLSKPINQFWLGFGIPLIVAGLAIRWISIFQLGKSFTVDVAINDTASLKMDGIYQKVRHPSYSGILLIVTGFSAIMSSLYSFLVLVVPVFIAIVYRITVEEKLLQSSFGKTYSDYKKETKKLIPGIY